MILFIHTADLEYVNLALIDKGLIFSQAKFKAKYRQSEKLLPAIDKLLKKQKCKLSSLQAIGVVCGPGPFTALRIGIAIANTLAWTNKIPAFGIKLEELSDMKKIAEIIERKSKKAKVGQIVLPFYGKEPNITLGK